VFDSLSSVSAERLESELLPNTSLRIVVEFDPDAIETNPRNQDVNPLEPMLSLSAEFQGRYYWDEEPVRLARYAAWPKERPYLVGTGSTVDEALAGLADALRGEARCSGSAQDTCDLVQVAKTIPHKELMSRLRRMAYSPVLSDDYALVLRP
jgi:hypothetical protein